MCKIYKIKELKTTKVL